MTIDHVPSQAELDAATAEVDRAYDTVTHTTGLTHDQAVERWSCAQHRWEMVWGARWLAGL